MPFDVGIKITAESQLEGVKAAEGSLQKLNQTARQVSQEAGQMGAALRQSGAAASAAVAGSQELQASHTALGAAGRSLKHGLADIVSDIGLTGPAARVAAIGMLQLHEGISKMTGAALGAGLGLTAVLGAIKGVKESFKEIEASFDPKNLEATNQEITKLSEQLATYQTRLGGFKQVGDIIQGVLLGEKDLVLGAIVGEEKLQALQTGRASAQAKAIGEATVKVREHNEILKAQLTGDPLAKISAEQGAALHELARHFAEVSIGAQKLEPELNEAVRTSFAMQSQLEILSTGTKLVAEGFERLGLTAKLPREEMNALAREAFKLESAFQGGALTADQFAAGLRKLAEQAVAGKESTASLLEVFKGSLTAGEKRFDLFEPLGKSITSGNLKQRVVEVQNEFSTVLKGAAGPSGQVFGFQLDDFLKRLRKVGEEAQREFGLFVPPDLQAKLNGLETAIRGLAEKKGITLTADGSQATKEAEAVKKAIDDIPSKKTTTIEVKTAIPGGSADFIGDIMRHRAGVQPISVPEIEAQMRMSVVASPAMPFSQFFNSYAPSVIKDFATNASSSINFDSNILQAIFHTLDAMSNARIALAGLNVAGGFPTGVHPSFIAQRQAQFVAQGEESQNILSFLMRLLSASASAGAAGGGTMLNVDLRGATMSREFLDREMIPALERLLVRATGQTGQFRLLN